MHIHIYMDTYINTHMYSYIYLHLYLFIVYLCRAWGGRPLNLGPNGHVNVKPAHARGGLDYTHTHTHRHTYIRLRVKG